MKQWIVLAAIVSSGVALADRWAPPPPFMASKNGDFRLYISEKTSNGIHLTLRCKNRGNWEEIWRIKSPQSASPYKVHISSDGKSVVLQDEWHSVGLGKVLVFLGERGSVRSTYKLEDLIKQDEKYRYTRSISSLWWTDQLSIGFLEGGKHFGLVTKFGTAYKFSATSGKKMALTSETRKTLIRELKKNS